MKKKKLNKAEVPQKDGNGTLTEVEPKKQRKRRYILLYLAIIGFAFYAVITIVNQNVQIADKKAELNELQQQINVVEIQTQYIKNVQGYKGKELSDYMEKIAKERFGYIGEGERIFFNVTD